MPIRIGDASGQPLIEVDGVEDVQATLLESPRSFIGGEQVTERLVGETRVFRRVSCRQYRSAALTCVDPRVFCDGQTVTGEDIHVLVRYVAMVPLGDLVQILAVVAAVIASIVALIVSAVDRRNARQIAVEDRAAAVALAAQDRDAAVALAAQDREAAAQLAADDRAAAARVAHEDRRESLRHARLLHELDTLSKLLTNLNRGGSSDQAESKRMGAEALTLIGMLGQARLPTLWADRAGDEDKLRAAYEDPDMPEYKKNALEAQLAVNAILREIDAILDSDPPA